MIESRAQGKSEQAVKNYETFYAGKGWGTSLASARLEVDRICDSVGWKEGTFVLDLGCGEGTHTEALRLRGIRSLGIDISSVGIRRAQETFPESSFICADAAEMLINNLDGIFCRGMSWFHYELNGVNRYGIDVPYETKRFFSWLKEGGVFVLQISTDFSDTMSKGGVLNNPFPCYLDLFRPLGKVVLLTDWKGNTINSGRQHATGIVIGVRKDND